MSAGPVAPVRRLFIALPLSGEAKASLAAWRPKFAVKCVRAEDAHVTLCFLGGVEERRLGAVRAAAGRALAGVSGGAGRLEGLGFFPDGKRPRVLWAAVTEGAPLIAGLARRLAEALKGEGFAVEDRPFVPHVTLGRFDAAPRDLKGTLSKDGGLPRGRFPVDRVFLYESRPGPRGSDYDVLDLWTLAGS